MDLSFMAAQVRRFSSCLSTHVPICPIISSFGVWQIHILHCQNGYLRCAQQLYALLDFLLEQITKLHINIFKCVN